MEMSEILIFLEFTGKGVKWLHLQHQCLMTTKELGINLYILILNRIANVASSLKYQNQQLLGQ